MTTVDLRPLAAAEASRFQGLTYPSYRHLLALAPAARHPGLAEQKVVQPVGIAAWAGDAPIGLALGELPLEDALASPEVLSLYVSADWRRRGIGTRLLGALEDETSRRGFGSLTAVYMTGKPGSAAVERLLEKRGWPLPETRSVTTRFTLDEAERTPWFGRVQPSERDFRIFSWQDLTAAERDELRRSHETAPWIAEGLEPWRHESYGYEPVSSVGARYKGSVVGWVINHVVDATTVRFTCSFMRQDLSRRGRILPLYTESLRRLRQTPYTTAMFITPMCYKEMVEFVRRRCAPWGSFFGETRGATKPLLPAVVSR
jgi:GNAT superfamily N-acetyltransferase